MKLMEIKEIKAGFTVSDQITNKDLKILADNNVKSIICNRPDSESADQTNIRELKEDADSLQIEIHYLPVVHDTISSRDVSEFEEVFNSSAKPVHAYCRSGLRAITLWSLMQIKAGVPVNKVIATAQQAGFDFSKFEAKFSQVIEALQHESKH